MDRIRLPTKASHVCKDRERERKERKGKKEKKCTRKTCYASQRSTVSGDRQGLCTKPNHTRTHIHTHARTCLNRNDTRLKLSHTHRPSHVHTRSLNHRPFTRFIGPFDFVDSDTTFSYTRRTTSTRSSFRWCVSSSIRTTEGRADRRFDHEIVLLISLLSLLLLLIVTVTHLNERKEKKIK